MKVLLTFSTLIVASLGLGSFCGPRFPEATPVAVSDFPIASAAAHSLHDQLKQNQITLLYFGFTNCTDYCPSTLKRLSTSIQELRPEKQANVGILFISVDPARDTQEKLERYAANFGPRVTGASSSRDTLVKMLHSLSLQTQLPRAELKEKYNVDHSTMVFWIQNNSIIKRIPASFRQEDLVHDLDATL